jgi:hypothetical protein
MLHNFGLHLVFESVELLVLLLFLVYLDSGCVDIEYVLPKEGVVTGGGLNHPVKLVVVKLIQVIQGDFRGAVVENRDELWIQR